MNEARAICALVVVKFSILNITWHRHGSAVIFYMILWWYIFPLIGPPGDLRASQQCILACTARTISWDNQPLFLSLNKSSELG